MNEFKGECITMNEETLLRLKQIELETLKVFHEYCAKHSLQYYLIGGALLGAVRYGGFIPWDDDIDVGMLREDYERLKKICNRDPIDGYFLQYNETDPAFARGIIKLRLNNTKVVELSSKNVKMHNGIYIDIFPIDYVDRNKGIALYIRGWIIKKLLTLRAIKSGYDNERFSIIKNIIKTIVPVGKIKIDQCIEVLSTLSNNKKRSYAILWVHNYHWKNQIHELHVFGRGSQCTFEGYTFIAPANKELFLTKVFGVDYLNEPPVQKRKTPHNYIMVDFGD